MRILMLGLMVSIAALLLVGCGEKMEDVQDVQPDTTPTPPAPVVPEQPQETAPVEPVVKSGVDLGTTELLSDLSCADKVVTATVTNVGEEEVMVADIQFQVNAVPDADPVCDAEVLAPGESTVCSSLEAPGRGVGTQVVFAKLSSNEQMVQKVTCAKMMDDDMDEESGETTE